MTQVVLRFREWHRGIGVRFPGMCLALPGSSLHVMYFDQIPLGSIL